VSIDQSSKEPLDHSDAPRTWTSPSHTIRKTSHEYLRKIERVINKWITKLAKRCRASHVQHAFLIICDLTDIKYSCRVQFRKELISEFEFRSLKGYCSLLHEQLIEVLEAVYIVGR